MFRITAILGLSLLSACASDEPLPSPKPTPLSGEQILRESQGMAQLGERYKQGESLMHEGESQVDQGKKLMAEGQRMIADGKRIMREMVTSKSSLYLPPFFKPSLENTP